MRADRAWVRGFLVGLAVMLVVESVVLWGISAKRLRPVTARTPSPYEGERYSPEEVRIGPWGVLQTRRIPLMAPDYLLPDGAERLAEPRWFFQDFSAQELRKFFQSCPLEAKQKAVLLDTKSWMVYSNGCALAPPQSLILSLSPAARQKIYCTLAQSPSNYAQYRAFVFPTNVPGFHNGGLSDESIGLIEGLTYIDQGQLSFADLQTVKNVMPAAEFERLLRALYHVPAYRLRLRVTQETDIQAVIRYWGRGGRERLIGPLIEGLQQVPGGASISITSLLPPFAATRLYTFPCSWDDPNAGHQDCFFTALNFFRETGDTNFLNPEAVERALESDYAPIKDQPTYGDLVLLMSEGRECMHVCVYIADDFVFTKNGLNTLQPWVLMRLRDMLSYYPSKTPPRIIIVRHKGEHGGESSRMAARAKSSYVLVTNRVPVRFRAPSGRLE
jgi:hypothetical protein